MNNSMSPSAKDEAADLRWAWSAPSSSPRKKERALPAASPLQAELRDVVRLLSTNTIEVQTSEPSFTQTLRQVHMAGEGHRTIALQVGTTSRNNHASTQVNETDVAEVPDASDALDDELHGTDGRLAESPWKRAWQGEGQAHSIHVPHCDVPADQYPTFISDAKAVGVCNRYGFVARPKPPVELPPRRRVKAINPVDYPHLYGTHDLYLDEGTSNRLNRTHNLWVSSSGFVPKF